eukprot:3096960-Rhodomonas_salina.1
MFGFRFSMLDTHCFQISMLGTDKNEWGSSCDSRLPPSCPVLCSRRPRRQSHVPSASAMMTWSV